MAPSSMHQQQLKSTSAKPQYGTDVQLTQKTCKLLDLAPSTSTLGLDYRTAWTSRIPLFLFGGVVFFPLLLIVLVVCVALFLNDLVVCVSLTLHVLVVFLLLSLNVLVVVAVRDPPESYSSCIDHVAVVFVDEHWQVEFDSQVPTAARGVLDI